MNQETNKLVLATLAYYDLFDFPLRTDEITRYLVVPKYLQIDTDTSHDSINISLYSLLNTNKVSLSDGFYTLPNREHLVAMRVRNSKIAAKKMRRARFGALIMSSLPYIQAVFASGSLALGNTDYDSDLDIFIITKGGRIWTARFIANTLFDLLGLKRKPKDKIAPNKLCFNHYIADNALQIKNWNVFTARVYLHLNPLYLRDSKIIQKFKKENDWVHDYVNSWDFPQEYLVKNYALLKFKKSFWEGILNSKLGDLVESVVRRYQIRRIERNPLTRNPHGRIEYNDHHLEFHPHSIESSVIADYTTRLKNT